MYILVEIVERDIETPQRFSSYEDAYSAMLGRLAEVTDTPVEELEAISPDDCLDSFGKTTESAWATVHDTNYDWKIFSVPDNKEGEEEPEQLSVQMLALTDKYGMSKEDAELLRKAALILDSPLQECAKKELDFRLSEIFGVKPSDLSSAVEACLTELDSRNFDDMFDYDGFDNFICRILDERHISHR